MSSRFWSCLSAHNSVGGGGECLQEINTRVRARNQPRREREERNMGEERTYRAWLKGGPHSPGFVNAAGKARQKWEAIAVT